MTALTHPVASPPVQSAPSSSHDIGSLAPSVFEEALARLETRKVRMARILDSVLVPDAHFGKPPGIKKPILYRAGADELASAFRLEIVTDPGHPDVVIVESDFASVTVHRAILDGAGRVVARTTAACTSKEKRFRRADGNGWTYSDAREVLNDLHAMAEKRAFVRLTVSALGLAAWLAAEEEMTESLAEPDTPITPWTPEERQRVYKAAADRGIGKQAFRDLVGATLGREKVGTGEDVAHVLAAIAAWNRPTPEPSGDDAPASDPSPRTTSPDPETSHA